MSNKETNTYGPVFRTELMEYLLHSLREVNVSQFACDFGNVIGQHLRKPSIELMRQYLGKREWARDLCFKHDVSTMHYYHVGDIAHLMQFWCWANKAAPEVVVKNIHALLLESLELQHLDLTTLPASEFETHCKLLLDAANVLSQFPSLMWLEATLNEGPLEPGAISTDDEYRAMCDLGLLTVAVLPGKNVRKIVATAKGADIYALAKLIQARQIEPEVIRLFLTH